MGAPGRRLGLDAGSLAISSGGTGTGLANNENPGNVTIPFLNLPSDWQGFEALISG